MSEESDEPDSREKRESNWCLGWLRSNVLRMTEWMLAKVGIRRDWNRKLDVLDVMRGVRVRDLMTHRTDMRCVDVSDSAAEVVSTCLASDVSNWLVTENGDRDRVVGMLDVRRLMVDVTAGIMEDTLESYIKQVERLLDVNTVSDVLDALVGRDIPLIVLMDEYGGTAGVVTKSDVMRVMYVRLRRTSSSEYRLK